MPTISPYTPELVLPNYITTNYDTSLEFQILAKKQQDYNTVLQRLNNLKSTTLNISMLNQVGSERLEKYNQELNDTLNSDLGDLSDAKVQTKVASLFTKIATDTDLKRRSQLSRFYQDQLSSIDQMQKSKDPTKSGYNSINDFVFRNWEGGLNDFIQADNINGWENKQQRYVPYKDIDQKLVNLTKLLHAESEAVDSPIPDNQGYSMLQSEKGVSKQRVRTLLQSALDQDELSQMEVLSKYRILQQGGNKEALYNSYNDWISEEKGNIQQQLKQAKAYKAQYDPSHVDSKLPDNERKQKQAEYQALQDYYSKQEEKLTANLLKAEKEHPTRQQWEKYSPTEMLPYINQMTVENYVNGISDALSWKESVKKVGTDNTYFANRKLNVMEQRLQLDAELGKARLELEKYKAAKESQKGSSYSSPADIFKSPESVIDSWETFLQTEKQYSANTSPIITTDGFRPEQLSNKKWLEENKDNYEVKLWNAYEAKFYDKAFLDDKRKQPNIDGFKAFQAQVMNGDYKTDPLINQITENYSRDKDIAKYYNDIAQESAEAINNVTDIVNLKLPGGDHTLGDYARMNGWTGKGDMTFGLPNGKGGYTQMTLKQLQDEYKKRKPNWAEETFLTLGSAALSAPFAPGVKNEIDNAIFSEDPELFRLVGMSLEQQNKNSSLVENALMEKLPQQFQGKQLVALDDNTRTQSIGFINQAIKLSSEDNPVSIDPTQVTNVSIPFGTGTYGGFSITEKEAERLSAAGAKIVTVGGELKEPQANVWYKVPMSTTAPYDAVYNDIFEKKGMVQRSIQGHKVQITAIRNDPSMMIINIDGKTQTVPKRDVNAAFSEIEQGITLFEKAKQQPK